MAARNVWEDMPRECAVATMMDVEYADGEELYRRLRSVDADWDEITKFAEDDELDHFMRAWFLVAPERMEELCSAEIRQCSERELFVVRVHSHRPDGEV